MSSIKVWFNMITSKALFLQNLNQEYISDVDGYQPRQLLAVFNETFTNQSVFLGNSTSFDFNVFDETEDTVTMTRHAGCPIFTTISSVDNWY
jgi:hypothetical protein